MMYALRNAGAESVTPATPHVSARYPFLWTRSRATKDTV